MTPSTKPTYTAPRSSRLLPLRWHLVLLVAGTLVPIVLFAVLLVHHLARAGRDEAGQRLSLVASSLAGALDREISSTSRTLQALAESERLDEGEFAAFHAEAARVAKTQPTWATVILLTPQGRQLVNSAMSYGTPLPSANEPDSLQRVVETRRPVIGELALGKAGGRWAFPIRVPVIRNGELLYVLSAVLTSEALEEVVTAPTSLEGEWLRSVVDSSGRIVVRTREPERFIGQKVTETYARETATAPHGVFRSTTLDGMEVYVAYHRLSMAPWKASISIPVHVLEAPEREVMALVILLGTMLFLLSCLGALLLSRRLSRSIDSAAGAAQALAQGAPPHVEYSGIREITTLAEALQSSSQLLLRREQERDENLTRAEAARDEAEAANRLKDEFLATLSHELRTPLTAILGWTNLLRLGNLDDAAKTDSVGTIERNARALTSLVDDLLDMSRIITGKLRLETMPVDFAGVVNSAVATVRPALDAKNIDLRLNLQASGYVVGDQQRLQQVVWNLLSNAVKFTPPGGRVEILLTEANNDLKLEVRDSGVGIEPEFRPYVFDRFRQSDGSTTRKYGGLGLGLSIVRQLVTLHGGTASVKSEGTGKGATFIVTLPLAGSRRDAGESTPAPITSQSEAFTEGESKLAGSRVLVVDDEPDARTLVAAILTQKGAEVRACASAGEAIAEVQTWKPSVIISDIGMPEQDGYDFIKQVREWESKLGRDATPAAALTAYARPEDRDRALAAGYQAHIAKPIEPTLLTNVVNSLLLGA